MPSLFNVIVSYQIQDEKLEVSTRSSPFEGRFLGGLEHQRFSLHILVVVSLVLAAAGEYYLREQVACRLVNFSSSYLHI